MTSLLDRAPDVDPLLGRVREVNLLLDRMLAAVDDDLAPAGCAGMVTELERLGRRVDALRLKVVARGETATVARGAGFPDTASWLARQSQRSRPDAAKQAQLADDLGAAPVTGAAMARGALSVEHAAVITAALAKLPAGVTAEQRAAVEAELVAKADRFDPAQLRRVARRALEAIEPDPAVVDAAEDEQIHDEEEQAHAKARFTFHTNDDGTVSGHFTVGDLAFSYLRKILDAMTAPRRQCARTPGRPDATDSGRASGATPDWAQRRGEAFSELLAHLPTDHLHAKTSATVVVHLDHDVLLGALRAAGLDTAQRISSAEARRLACTAGIIPAVFGGRSLPLDLGVEQRLFTHAQRIALSAQHTTCAADGCQRPFAWCEIHHRQPWSHGGRTDLLNAVPLCWYHHRRAHAT